MKTTKLLRYLATAFCLSITLLLLAPIARGQTIEVLHSFNSSDGRYPNELVQGSDGNFYGTTSRGGDLSLDNGLGFGTIFKITPAGILTTLVTFNISNGAAPYAGLVQGSDGNFYGVTALGGDYSGVRSLYGLGTVFKMTPSGELTRLISFNGSNGAQPVGRLIEATDGNFYGALSQADQEISPGNFSSAFRMTPQGELTMLAGYLNLTQSGLIQAGDGNFYGGTVNGAPSVYTEDAGYSFGTIFRITPDGTMTTLVSFDGSNGGYVVSALVEGSDGNLYGTSIDAWTVGGGSPGTVFRISLNGELTDLGRVPVPGHMGELVQGRDAKFYGATANGGTANLGTIFQMTVNGEFTTLVSFTGSIGDHPFGKIVEGNDGNFYGTTPTGGAYGYGTVFRLIMPQTSVITSLSPSSAQAGSEDLLVTISGTGFVEGTTILWNATELVASSRTENEISVIVPGALVQTTADLETVIIKVKSPTGELSNSEAFTILSNASNVITVESAIVTTGEPVMVSIAPASDADAGVAATLTHEGEEPASVTVALYNEDPSPTGASFEVAGSFLDINVSGATLNDSMIAFFYYPAGASGLALKFYNQETGIWEDVSPFLDDPINRRFEVRFDANSRPKITELTGTLFAAAVPDQTPPAIACPNIIVPCSVEELVSVSYPAPTTLTDNIDNPSQITLTYSIPSGSAFKVGTTTVTCTATDASGNASTTTFIVTRQPLGFEGFLAPIGGADASGGSFSAPVRTFKSGSTVPVKFTANCDGSPILMGIHHLLAVKYSNATTSGEPIDATPQDAATAGNQFRLSGGQWHFNLDTKATGLTSGIWQLIATLSDGSQHRVWIQIK